MCKPFCVNICKKCWENVAKLALQQNLLLGILMLTKLPLWPFVMRMLTLILMLVLMLNLMLMFKIAFLRNPNAHLSAPLTLGQEATVISTKFSNINPSNEVCAGQGDGEGDDDGDSDHRKIHYQNFWFLF